MKDLNRLKLALIENKKTSKWLADHLAVHTTTVSKWCTNTIQPDLVTLNRIANLLDIDVKTLILSNKN
jgi:transcriptional regulator with XRE-family HTH domain